MCIMKDNLMFDAFKLNLNAQHVNGMTPLKKVAENYGF